MTEYKFTFTGTSGTLAVGKVKVVLICRQLVHQEEVQEFFNVQGGGSFINGGRINSECSIAVSQVL
ncbi:hypothetical protein VNN36_10450 [Lactococcus garvieae]|uniref:hypothetical protein n=1 Tax=Lactococcus garvieae TaxID=1363 RepID=UPI0030D3505A